jgi:hypothetical protein
VAAGGFVPSGGANNIALALFSFPSLARCKRHQAAQAASLQDARCLAAFAWTGRTQCIIGDARS